MLSFASEDSAKFWLTVFEWLLIGSAVILVGGIIGEWPDSETWKVSRLYKLAKAAVIVGVVGELMADGAIFNTSSALETIEGRAIAKAETDAAKQTKKLRKRRKEPQRSKNG